MTLTFNSELLEHSANLMVFFVLCWMNLN